MEIIFKFGADKRKDKLIEELRKENKELTEENRINNIEISQLKADIRRLNGSLNYYKKVRGNGKVSNKANA